MRLRFFIISILLLTSACGFQLRGSQFSDFTATNIYIENRGALNLSEQVGLQLEGVGVTLVDDPQNAEYIITLKEERFSRSVLSVSAATGKVQEYLITYTAKMDAREQGGKPLVSNDKILMSRDYTFDENAVLGKASEETVIREDLVFRAASQVMRRLQALISKTQS